MFRPHLVFTQSPHLEPPYALRTVFLVFEIVAYLRGLSAGTYIDSRCGSDNGIGRYDSRLTPGRAMPQSPHLGAVASFPMWW